MWAKNSNYFVIRKSNLKKFLTVQTVLDHWFCSKNCPANILSRKKSLFYKNISSNWYLGTYYVLIYNLLIFRKSCLWRLCREGLNLQVVRGLQMMLSTVLSISLKRLIWALLENLSCKGWSKTFWKNWGLETIRKWNKDVEKWQIYSAQIFFASYSLQPVCTVLEDFYINHVYIWFVFIDEMKFLRKERKFWQI